MMFYFSTLLRHFEHTIDEVPDCIKQALNASKLLVQSSPHFLLPILTVLWFVGSVGKLTSMHENLWITKLHHHIVVVITFWYTAGNEFQLVPMHLFVHFFAHSAFYRLILFCSRSEDQNLPLRTCWQFCVFFLRFWCALDATTSGIKGLHTPVCGLLCSILPLQHKICILQATTERYRNLAMMLRVCPLCSTIQLSHLSTQQGGI